jgi:hypothetical protein
MYGPSTGLMVAPGAAVVSAGPDIVDIAIVSMFLVMAASAAATALKGADGDDDYDSSGEGGRGTAQHTAVLILHCSMEGCA